MLLANNFKSPTPSSSFSSRGSSAKVHKTFATEKAVHVDWSILRHKVMPSVRTCYMFELPISCSSSKTIWSPISSGKIYCLATIELRQSKFIFLAVTEQMLREFSYPMAKAAMICLWKRYNKFSTFLIDFVARDLLF